MGKENNFKYQPGDIALFNRPEHKGLKQYTADKLTPDTEYTICYSDEVDDVCIIYLCGHIGYGFDEGYFTIFEKVCA